jgi:hypothetical protein
VAGRAPLLAVLGVSLAVAVAAPAAARPADVVDCNA